MGLTYSKEISDDFKDRITWWFCKLNNIKIKISQDPWVEFMLCWVIFDAYLTEISKKDSDRKRLTFFYNNQSDFKDRIQKRKVLADKSVFELKRLSPVKDMRPNKNESVHLVNEKDLEQVIEFVYQIRCNLFHGAKNIRNVRDKELVRYGARFLRLSLDAWMNLE